jgi:hypothetical protein
MGKPGRAEIPEGIKEDGNKSWDLLPDGTN